MTIFPAHILIVCWFWIGLSFPPQRQVFIFRLYHSNLLQWVGLGWFNGSKKHLTVLLFYSYFKLLQLHQSTFYKVLLLLSNTLGLVWNAHYVKNWFSCSDLNYVSICNPSQTCFLLKQSSFSSSSFSPSTLPRAQSNISAMEAWPRCVWSLMSPQRFGIAGWHTSPVWHQSLELQKPHPCTVCLLAAFLPSTDEDESGDLSDGNGPFGLLRPLTFLLSHWHFYDFFLSMYDEALLAPLLRSGLVPSLFLLLPLCSSSMFTVPSFPLILLLWLLLLLAFPLPIGSTFQ